MGLKPKFLIIISLAVVVIGLISWLYYYLSYDLQRLSKAGEVIAIAESPNKKYVITVKKNSAGASSMSWNLVGIVGDRTNKEKIIYWDEGSEAKVKWIDEKTVIINDVELNIEKDTYDYRHDKKIKRKS
jgi:hypothetical protein